MALLDLKSLSGIITLLYAIIYGIAILGTSIKSAVEVKDMRKKRKAQMETDDDPHEDRYNDDDHDYGELAKKSENDDDDELTKQKAPKEEMKDESNDTKPTQNNEQQPLQQETTDDNKPETSEQTNNMENKAEEENVNVDDVKPEPNNPTDDSVEHKAEEEKTNTISRMNTVAVTIDDGNDKADVSGKFHRILEAKVSKNRNKDGEIYAKNIVVHWAKLLWSKKRVYMSLVPHIFDQATDFGVMVEYYRLYASGGDLGSMNPFWLFWISVFIIILARTISTVTVWVVTKNVRDTILQSLDLLIMKAVFISYTTNATKPTTMQRYLALLEAIFETSPQMVLSMVFVLKSTDNNSAVSPVIYISLLTSIASLTLKVISDDRMIFARGWEEIKFQHKWLKYKCKKPKDPKKDIPDALLNPKYIFRAFFRFLEITSRICILTLTWVIIGGFGLFLILGFEFLILGFFCLKLKRPDPFGMVIYMWFKIRRELEKYLKYFHYYRVISSFVYLLIITIFIFVKFEAWKVEEAYVRKQNSQGFGLVLLIYGWISVPLWLLIWYIIEQKMNGISWGGRVVRDPGELARGNNFQDLAELFEFGCTRAYTHDSAWWTAWKLLDKTCSEELFVRIAPYLTHEHPKIWNYIGPFKRTPLMERYWEVDKVKYIVSKFNKDVDLNVESENRDDEGYTFRKLVEEQHQFDIKIRGKSVKAPKEKLNDDVTKAFLKFLDANCK